MEPAAHDTTNEAPVFSESGGQRWIAVSLAVVGVAVLCLIVGIVADIDPLAGLGVAGLAIAPVWAVAAYSIARYSAIELTPTQLRIGRETAPVADITRVYAEAEIDPDVLERARNPMPSKMPGGRLFGGAWGLGVRQPVGFERTGIGHIEVFGTHRPDEIIGHLRALARA